MKIGTYCHITIRVLFFIQSILNGILNNDMFMQIHKIIYTYAQSIWIQSAYNIVRS